MKVFDKINCIYIPLELCFNDRRITIHAIPIVGTIFFANI